MLPGHQIHGADVTQVLETCPGTSSVPHSAIVEKSKRNQFSFSSYPLVKDAFNSKWCQRNHLLMPFPLKLNRTNTFISCTPEFNDFRGNIQPLGASALLVAEGRTAGQKQQQHSPESTHPTSPAHREVVFLGCNVSVAVAPVIGQLLLLLLIEPDELSSGPGHKPVQALEVPQSEARGFLHTMKGDSSPLLCSGWLLPPSPASEQGCSGAGQQGWTLCSPGSARAHLKPTHHQLAVLCLQLAERLCVAGTEVLRHFTLKDEKCSCYPTQKSIT